MWSDREISPNVTQLKPNEWISTAVRLPEHGELIVKHWRATGEVWACIYNGNTKDTSFDEWISLPLPLPLSSRKQER